MNIFKAAVNILYPPSCPMCGEVLHLSERAGHWPRASSGCSVIAPHVASERAGTKRNVAADGDDSYDVQFAADGDDSYDVQHSEASSRPCKRCRAKLKYLGENCCMKCGKPLEDKDRELCFDCGRMKHLYDQGAAVFEYTEGIKQSIYRYKYNGCREFALWYGEEMYERLAGRLAIWRPQVIMPVPLHAKKLRVRGYNQAELIARRLGELSGICVDVESLIRCRATVPQKSLDDIQRAENIKKAFTIASNTLKYKRVLLVDDIYTTGATVDACAGTLKAAGADKVFAASLCIGRGV